MKKTLWRVLRIILIIVLAFVLLFFAAKLILISVFPDSVFRYEHCPPYNTQKWQAISVRDCGTLKIPQNWTLYEKDGIFYIVDENNKPMMIEIDLPISAPQTNDFFSYSVGKSLYSQVFSNNVFFGKKEIINNDYESRYFLEYLSKDGKKSVIFIVWDDSISYDLVKTIAATFVSEYVD